MRRYGYAGCCYCDPCCCQEMSSADHFSSALTFHATRDNTLFRICLAKPLELEKGLISARCGMAAKSVRTEGAAEIRFGAKSLLTQKRQARALRSEEHTSELQSHSDLVCRLLLE